MGASEVTPIGDARKRVSGFSAPSVGRTRNLGEILIDDGLLTAEQVETARQEHEKTGKSLGRVLIDLGLVPEAALVKALATQIGLPFVDLSESQIDPTAAALIPVAGAKRYMALPIGFEDESLVV